MLTDIILYTFLAAFFIQTIYQWGIFSRLSFYQKKPVSTTNKPLSVIVCARNEVANLKTLFDSIFAQDYPDFEVIMVNDRSSDGTKELLFHLQKEYPNLRIVNVENTPPKFNPKKYAITLGVKTAKYDDIVLTDADCYPAGKNWLKEIAAARQTNVNYVLGYSPYEKKKGFLNTFIRFETFFTALQYLSFAISGMPYMGVGRNLSYSRSAFLEHKGFRKYFNITGGDDDLLVNQYANRKNTAIAIGREGIVYSKPELNWKDFFQQKKRHLSVGKYYSVGSKMILGLYTLSHIVFWLSLIACLIFWLEPYWLLGGLLFRWLTIVLLYTQAGNKIGEKINWWFIPIFDILYLFYFIVTGVSALFSKDIQWN